MLDLDINIIARKVDELVGRGYTYLPISESLVNDARTYYKGYIADRLEYEDWASQCFTRAGENEPDQGLTYRERDEGKDVKFFFHFEDTPEFHQRWDKACEGRQQTVTASFMISSMLLLRHEVFKTVEMLLPGLSTRFPSRLWDLQSPFDFEIPWSTTTLRSLYYPQAPGQTGARRHLDRGLLTAHLGDEGGHLLAHASKTSDDGNIISPRPGKMLVFWGVKSLWVTGGQIKPLWHSSTCEEGKDRFAFVQFNHVELPGYEVRDAKEAYDYYWTKVHGKAA